MPDQDDPHQARYGRPCWRAAMKPLDPRLLRHSAAARGYLAGAEGYDGYRGSLHVTERLSGSEVHIHVAIPDNRLGPSPDGAATEIQRGIKEAFDRLARLIAT